MLCSCLSAGWCWSHAGHDASPGAGRAAGPPYSRSGPPNAGPVETAPGRLATAMDPFTHITHCKDSLELDISARIGFRMQSVIRKQLFPNDWAFVCKLLNSKGRVIEHISPIRAYGYQTETGLYGVDTSSRMNWGCHRLEWCLLIEYVHGAFHFAATW